MPTPIRLGMIGGGMGGFIGSVHRIAARMDGQYQLVAGVLSSDFQKSLDSAEAAGISKDRIYDSISSMLSSESRRTDGIEAVSIVTPNHLHYSAASACLNAGLHVICDKPITATLTDALSLAEIAKRSGRHLVLTHNYTGYPAVRQMRAMVQAGELGALRVVAVEYVQGWLTEKREAQGARGAEWRTDPSRAGAGGALGDIGTHAINLATYVLGERPSLLLADLNSFVPGRRLDDNASVFLRYDSGVRGTLWVSQVAAGEDNNLGIRIFGSTGGLEWRQESPELLTHSPLGRSPRRISRGGSGSSIQARSGSRVPAGHPEGYLEAFANIYRDAARLIREQSAREELLLPGVDEGIDGLRFVEACVASHRAGNSWIKL